MKSFTRIVPIVFLIGLSGCATITRGRKEVLVIESEPSGAVVTIEKEGYETVRVQVESQVAGAGAAGMAGNVILGGLIGAAVDAGTGATLQLKPNPIQVKLVPIGGLSEPKDDSEENKPVSLLIEIEPCSDGLALLKIREISDG